jgi:hypothetical protein
MGVDLRLALDVVNTHPATEKDDQGGKWLIAFRLRISRLFRAAYRVFEMSQTEFDVTQLRRKEHQRQTDSPQNEYNPSLM